jgi:catalase
MSTKPTALRGPNRKECLALGKELIGKFTTRLMLVILVPTGAYAQTSTTKSTPSQMVDALHSAFGKHPNARAVHAKGIIMEGEFEPDPKAKALSIAVHLQGKSLPVTFRFSDFTEIPDIPDNRFV